MEKENEILKIPKLLEGHLLSWVSESIGESSICIYGDPEGLRSLGNALLAIAYLDQSKLKETECPTGDSFHQHYLSGRKVSDRAVWNLKNLTVGGVDAKGTGEIRDVFPPKKL